ncbi:hypothetical protein AVEN_221398-1 [Araneus ventricosus]|uniref:Nucleolar complex protein 2 homolog n=1 Tax=Araneus ventricosus TaxID=182803 RepID=A0A4Y2SRP3_ARAVE|nr:hypothetical protein AVEN_221398-1 [Araneus ventricosus]
MSSDSEVEEASIHAATLKKLKYKDPDFYEFLKENDKELLDFKYSESEDDEPEVANDEESNIKISAKKLTYIKENISSAPTIKLCKALISAFKSAVNQADGSDKKIDMSNSEFFNDVVKLCLIDLVPALYKVLHLSAEPGKKKIDPTRSKVWKKVQMSVKSYLIDMLKMISRLDLRTVCGPPS